MDILGFIAAVINLTEVKVLAALLMANFFSGILSAAITGAWDWTKLKDIWKRTGAIFGAYLVFSVVAYYVSEWSAIRVAAYAFLIADLTKRIYTNLREMGIPLPEDIPVVTPAIKYVGAALAFVPMKLLGKNK